MVFHMAGPWYFRTLAYQDLGLQAKNWHFRVAVLIDRERGNGDLRPDPIRLQIDVLS